MLQDLLCLQGLHALQDVSFAMLDTKSVRDDLDMKG